MSKTKFSRVHFSARRLTWRTPAELFDDLNDEFQFTLDAAASVENALCSQFYTEIENALQQDWSWAIRVWVNPPYGRGVIDWVRKAYLESRKGALVCMLLPSRTGTQWFYEFAPMARDVRFLRGRLKFDDGGNSAPFDSLLLIFDGRNNGS